LTGKINRAGTQTLFAGIPECDVNGEVTANLPELPGAVDWVDDPDPRCLKPSGIILALLAEQRIIGPCLREKAGDQGVRLGVCEVTQTIGLFPGQVRTMLGDKLRTELKEEATSLLGDLHGDVRVVHVTPGH
jgi:hypothetical protein